MQLWVLIPHNLTPLPSQPSTETTKFAVPYNQTKPSGNLSRFPQTQISTSALLPFAQKVATDVNKPRLPLRKLSMVIDLSKAFGTERQTKFITAICNTTLHINIFRWLSSYRHECHASCRCNEVTSTCHAVRLDVSQISVISPVIFNFFISKYPHKV